MRVLASALAAILFFSPILAILAEPAILLNVTDNEGNVGSESFQLRVLASGSKAPRTIFIPPPPPFVVGRDVLFSFDGSYDFDGEIEAYHLSFGDGTDSGWVSQPMITHSYASQGNYLLLAKVRDDDGLVSRNVVTVSITVVSESEADQDEDDEPLGDMVLSPIALLVLMTIIILLIILVVRRGRRRGAYLNDGWDDEYDH